MKLFGKHVTKKDKRELFMQLLAVVLSGIFVVTLGVVSFAWFSLNSSVEHSGMRVVVSSESVDLLIDRTTQEYEDTTRYEGVAGEGGLKSVLAAKEYDFIETDTADAYLLAYELVVAENFVQAVVNFLRSHCLQLFRGEKQPEPRFRAAFALL